LGNPGAMVFLQPVTAGRLAAIRAVHTQTTMQLGILCVESIDFC
jgi:hypothetical protein